MAEDMIDALPVIVIVLPFMTAVVLALIGSWRIGIWINAGSASLLFLLACQLPWHLHAALPMLHVGVPEAQLVMLTSLVAMTTSWFSRREIPVSLAARLLDRRKVELYHATCQCLVGAILLALLSDDPVLTWFALAIAIAAASAITDAIRNQAAATSASRLLLLCSVGLMLALLGTLLLYGAADPHASALRWGTLQITPHNAAAMHLACVFLLVGYGALAGVAPLHGWLPGAATEGVAAGSIIVAALMVNAPLLVLMRLGSPTGLDPGLPADVLIALGLITLLLGVCCLFVQTDTRRTVALAGMTQVGIIAVAIGIGGPVATLAAWLTMTLLALARAAVLQCQDLPPTQLSAWTRVASMLALALLPLLALFLLAGAMVWLLLPLGVGVLLTSSLLLARLPMLAPAVAAPRGGSLSELAALAPIWLQLALMLLLAFAMPAPVLGWFNTMAMAR
jgi:hydrogenase-4 component F